MVHTDSHQRHYRFDAAVVFALTLGLYLATLATDYIGGDHGIFALIAAEGGYGHAPGYPLYSLILYGLGSLNIADLNWFTVSSAITAVIASFAVATWWFAARLWGASRAGAMSAALLFAFAPHVWFVHTQAEVFALNHLLVGAIVAICSPRVDPKLSSVAGLGLLFGLAACHHHTAVFVIPLGCVLVWRAAVALGWLRTISSFVAAFGTGLLPLLWLPWIGLTKPERWHWGDPSTLQGFLDLLLRRDFGTFSLTVDAADYAVLEQWRFLGNSLVDDFTLIGVLAALVGLALLPWRSHRAHSIALVVCLAAFGPFFASLIGRLPEGINYLLIRKFHVGFEAMLTIPIALGFTRFCAWLRPRWRLSVPAAIVAWMGFAGLPHQGALNDHAPDHYCQDLWHDLSPDAIVVGPGDHVAICSEFKKRAEGSIQGVFIAPSLLVHPWYRHRIEAEVGLKVDVEGQTIDITKFIRDMLDNGRSVYLTDNFHEEIVQTFPSYPRGLTIALLQPPARPPAPHEAASENALLYEEFVLEPRAITDENREAWRAFLQARYARTWESLAQILGDLGNIEGAHRAEQMGKAYSEPVATP